MKLNGLTLLIAVLVGTLVTVWDVVTGPDDPLDRMLCKEVTPKTLRNNLDCWPVEFPHPERPPEPAQEGG